MGNAQSAYNEQPEKTSALDGGPPSLQPVVPGGRDDGGGVIVCRPENATPENDSQV